MHKKTLRQENTVIVIMYGELVRLSLNVHLRKKSASTVEESEFDLLEGAGIWEPALPKEPVMLWLVSAW